MINTKDNLDSQRDDSWRDMMTRTAFLSIFALLIICSTSVSGINGGLISRNVPAYSLSGIANKANSADYGLSWLSPLVPTWLVYDLSGVPLAQRSKILVVYYNPAVPPFWTQSYDYDQRVTGHFSYNNLCSYTVEGNTTPGGTGSAPTNGWVVLVSVSNNRIHSRQHVINNFAGYNWLRLNVTVSDGTTGYAGVSCKLDVYDASTPQALHDNWIFYGDSITTGAMQPQPLAGSTTILNFSTEINNVKPDSFPIGECGAIAGITSGSPLPFFDEWLSIFPGHYCTINLGTNDAGGNQSTTTFYNNMKTMVQKILAAGKIPVIPLIPWARGGNVETYAPAMNAKIQQLYIDFPQIIHGPDFWSFFITHQNLISGDNLHPNTDGFIAYRHLWISNILMISNAFYTVTNGGGPPATNTNVIVHGPNTNTNNTMIIATKGGTFKHEYDYTNKSMTVTNAITAIFPSGFTTLKVTFTGVEGKSTTVLANSLLASNCIGIYQLTSSLEYSLKPVQFSFQYDPKLIPSGQTENQLMMYFFNGIEWVRVTGDLDLINHLFKFESNKLSGTYCLFASDPNKIETGKKTAKNPDVSQWSYNPFSPNMDGLADTTRMEIQLTSASKVIFQIFNRDHGLIRTLLNEQKLSGKTYVEWDGKDNTGKKVAPGAYVYMVKINNIVKKGIIVVAY